MPHDPFEGTEFEGMTPETFVLDQEKWDAFMALLDEPPKPNPRLRALFARRNRIIRDED